MTAPSRPRGRPCSPSHAAWCISSAACGKCLLLNEDEGAKEALLILQDRTWDEELYQSSVKDNYLTPSQMRQRKGMF